jgi:hypothetical protein
MNILQLTSLLMLSLMLSLSTLSVANNQTAQKVPAPLIEQYQLAAGGDTTLVEPVYKQFELLLEQHPNEPLVWVYFGSARTLKGRDTWLPWRKLSHTEQGLDDIQRGMGKLADQPLQLAQQQRVQGLPEYHLATALAATNFTSVPDFFNRFERGYDLFLQLLDDDEFLKQNFAASAWVYERAIMAALRSEDMSQAKLWLAIMQVRQADHPTTQSAIVLVQKSET